MSLVDTILITLLYNRKRAEETPVVLLLKETRRHTQTFCLYLFISLSSELHYVKSRKEILVTESFISWSYTCSKDSFVLHPDD